MLSRRHAASAARPAPLSALLLSAALVLTGCSSGSGDPDAPASSSTGAASGTATPTGDFEAVTVTDPAEGATGEAAVPAVDVAAPLSVAETTTRVLRPGDGAAAAEGDVVTVEFVGVNGTTGEPFGSSSFGQGQPPVSFVLGGGVIPGFLKALTGAQVGSRVLAAVAPADGYGPQGGLAQAQIGAEDTLVYLIDVVSVAPGYASGEAVDPATFPPGLPTVAVDPTTHAPTITVDSAATPPSDLVVQPLIRGTGAPVEAGQTLTVQYTGVTWSTGAVFDSSWEKGTPFTFQQGGGVIDGWNEGLLGVPVGSQVLLVVPPAKGYGDTARGEAIPAGSTLVFVVDVLSAG